MAMTSSGALRAALTQRRRRMSVSSGFSVSASWIVRGSSAMPQMGQLPGASRTISGCIGQVQVCLAGGGAGGSGRPPGGEGATKAPGFATKRSRQRAQQNR